MLRNKNGEIVTLIGIAGKAGAGKDTLAMALEEHAKFTTQSFAWPLKMGLAAMFNFVESDWYDRDWKERPLEGVGISPRRLAQTIGTDWGRRLDGDIWVKAAQRSIEAHSDTRIVIPDVRFENEARFIREHGTLLHVLRDSNSLTDAFAAQHESEAGVLIDITRDYVLRNESTLLEYQRACTAIAVIGHCMDNMSFDVSRYWNRPYENLEVADDEGEDDTPEDLNWAEPLITARQELERFYNDLINGKIERGLDRFNKARECIEQVAHIARTHGLELGYLNAKLEGR